jgi:hypothetical protein
MANLRRWISFSVIASVVMISMPPASRAQVPTQPMVETNTALAGPWEFTFDGRIGVPTGRLRVGEFPTGSSVGPAQPGTLFRLHDLGIDVSGTLEGSVGFHFTARDAVRASYLYYFLRGSSTQDRAVVFNGQEFTAGSLDTNADFYRVSLAYERTLFSRPSGEQLIGSVGLTYVNLNPTLTGGSPPAAASGPSGEAHGPSNSEDFYRQELPVPILGLRWDHPVGQHWLLWASVSGGGLPRVDSLRKEGGTVYLQQSDADAGIGLAYVIGPHGQLEAGYHFTYFFQHETSHEDNNLFELIDNGAQVRFTLRF